WSLTHLPPEKIILTLFAPCAAQTLRGFLTVWAFPMGRRYFLWGEFASFNVNLTKNCLAFLQRGGMLKKKSNLRKNRLDCGKRSAYDGLFAGG
ncbi:MAG: hypothetical protein U0M10_04915, partial [Oscillospiraceae bacterium]|nr:hypothetical protein [Oscillospiraceae bacterium]